MRDLRTTRLPRRAIHARPCRRPRPNLLLGCKDETFCAIPLGVHGVYEQVTRCVGAIQEVVMVLLYRVAFLRHLFECVNCKPMLKL